MLIRLFHAFFTKFFGKIKKIDEIIKKLYFEIPLPSEQQETVDFLVALENKISLEDSKLEKLFSVRNGLLQQLFI